MSSPFFPDLIKPRLFLFVPGFGVASPSLSPGEDDDDDDVAEDSSEDDASESEDSSESDEDTKSEF